MRLRTAVLTATLAPMLTGCATLRSTLDGWQADETGLSRSQRTLRTALQTGDFPAALGWREDDAMLRVLTSAAATYYAAQYGRSAALLDTAALLADARLTTSISRGALATVTNDLARLYQPRRTERLFVPYYGMLSYARLGEWEDAAVEARRMVSLLARFGEEREDGERALHAAMHYLAATVFERAGEPGEAAVAYRNANLLSASFPAQPDSRGAVGHGEVVLVVERGFVAHRTTETIRIAMGRDERDSLRTSDDSRRRLVDRLGARFMQLTSSEGSSDASASNLRQRSGHSTPAVASHPPRHVRSSDDDDDHDDDLDDLRLAFPTLRRSPRPWGGVPRLVSDSLGPAPDSLLLRVTASVDDASAADERRERSAVVARELARAAAKYAVTRAVRDRTGRVGGTVADIASTLLERADVRSWHVLPQEVVLLRVRLPAGRHRLRVVVGEGAGHREVDLGPVAVASGMLAVVPARIWAEPGPMRPRDAGRCELVVLTCVD